ncbi:hypothetical protein BC941DRAFT_476300 [Chlamydoabsidia padenii]|nr:hypothetical protein BC941DRAFT_476300 [Chlamydoabsidia padenii]
MSALSNVLGYVRRAKICGHLFILHYFTQRLVAGQAIPSVCFDYRFTYNVYQLMTGRQWSNTELFSEQLLTNIKVSFEEFKVMIPSAVCRLPSTINQGKAPNYFANIMAFIARSYVSNMNALRQLTGETSDCWGRLSGLTEVDRQPAIVDDTSHEKEDEYDTGTNAGNDKDNNDTDNKGDTGENRSNVDAMSLGTEQLSSMGSSSTMGASNLQILEEMNATDVQSQATINQVNRSWAHHELSVLPEWTYTSRRQKFKMTTGEHPGVTEVFVASNPSDPDAYNLETDIID